MIKRLFVAVVLVVSCVGCGELFVEPVRNYCDKEISYDLWKQENGYRLHLRVGAVDVRACRITPDVSREINLSHDVSSPEESDKLIEKYRRIYAERHAVRPTPVLAAKKPLKLPADVLSVCDQCLKPTSK